MPTAVQDTVETLEQRVRDLTPQQLAKFHEWYQEYRADLWDQQIEADAEAGRLDHLADQALRDFDQGLCTPL